MGRLRIRGGHALPVAPSRSVAESKTESRPARRTPLILASGRQTLEAGVPRAKVGEVTPRELFERRVRC